MTALSIVEINSEMKFYLINNDKEQVMKASTGKPLMIELF